MCVHSRAECTHLVCERVCLPCPFRLLELAGPSGARVVTIRCAEAGVYTQLGPGGPACHVSHGRGLNASSVDFSLVNITLLQVPSRLPCALETTF